MTHTKGAVETQRLFFALWPEPELQQRLARAAAALLPHADGRRVREANLHCTLVFLGAVEAAQRLCLEDAASLVRAEPFTLTLDRLGYFRRPQVAWLGCTTTPAALQALVAGLTLWSRGLRFSTGATALRSASDSGAQIAQRSGAVAAHADHMACGTVCPDGVGQRVRRRALPAIALLGFVKRQPRTVTKRKGPIPGPFATACCNQAMPGLPGMPLIFGVFGWVALMVFLWRMYSATTSQIGLSPTGFCSMLAHPATR